MLFDCWKKVIHENRSAFALCDCATGQRWTFEQLDAEAEKLDLPAGQFVIVQGNSWRFVCEVLASWRHQRVLCPLDPGQLLPQVESLPPGCVHLKVTSATSGSPKTIAFTGNQLLADVENITTTMGLRPDMPNIAAISLAHSYGFSNLILPLLLKGIPLVLLPAPLPQLLHRALQDWSSVTIPAVPALWRTWLQADVLSPSIKLAISAGAPLPVTLEDQVFQRCNLKIHTFYGSSECGGIAFDRTSVPRQDPAFVGPAMDNVELSLSSSGTLVVQSAAVGLGYLPAPSPNLHNGRFETSDLVEIRAGDVYLKGRLGDAINVAGRKISPETIETILRKHPAVQECVVFGVPSLEEERTEKIVACVQANGTNEADLKHFLSQHLPGWQIPREFWFVPEIAPNVRGKLSRSEWRARFLGL